MGRKWTPYENDYVRKHFAELGAAKVAERLGRSRNAVKERAYDMRIRGVAMTVPVVVEDERCVEAWKRDFRRMGIEGGVE